MPPMRTTVVDLRGQVAPPPQATLRSLLRQRGWLGFLTLAGLAGTTALLHGPHPDLLALAGVDGICVLATLAGVALQDRPVSWFLLAGGQALLAVSALAGRSAAHPQNIAYALLAAGLATLILREPAPVGPVRRGGAEILLIAGLAGLLAAEAVRLGLNLGAHSGSAGLVILLAGRCWLGLLVGAAALHPLSGPGARPASAAGGREPVDQDVLARGLAHDVNNVLGAIQLHARSLERSLQCEEPGRVDPARLATMAHQVGRIREASQRGAALVGQLTAPQAAREAPQVVDVRQAILDLRPWASELAGPAVAVRVAVGDTALRVLADTGGIERVLTNLILNARDALGGCGTLTITGAEFRLEQASGLGLQPGTYVRIGVADTGCGMAPEVAARAFEPDFTTKPPGRGTGLGLSSVRAIVRACGGEVAIATAPRQGTTVEVFLPGARQCTAPGGRR
jgi:signal transduction histidine kinase